MAQTRLAVLDGLRGIAVLLVLWYHIWELSWLPAPLGSLQFIPETGFVGVHLFFFISGFVIVYPFIRAQIEEKERPSWGHFAYRRAIKIVPSYLLSIAFVFAVGYTQTKFGSTADLLRSLFAHLFFIHTWWNDTYGNINGVLWTLAVEVQFYIVFPLIWLGFKRAPWLTALGMTAIAIAWRVEAQRCCAPQLSHMIDNLPGYLDIFACGMLSAYVYVRRRDLTEKRFVQIAATLISLAGFVWLVAMLQNLFGTRTVDQWSTVWQIVNRSWLGLSFALIATGALFGLRGWKAVLANPVTLFLGIISYNLYLYHQVIARLLVTWHLPQYVTRDPHNDHHWQIVYTWVAFTVTIAQAALVTYAFERPILRLKPEWWAGLVSRGRTERALPPM